MGSKRCAVLAVCGLLGLVLLLLALSSRVVASPSEAAGSPGARPQGDFITVCPSAECDYTTIQEAVDAASDGDTIKVAAGTYTDLSVRPRNDITTTGVVTQVVYISKTVTIWGGYSTTNWETSDPEAWPTTLDAQGQGRVLYVTGEITVTIEGLRITGGDASEATSQWPESADGGGAYVITAVVTISNCGVFANAAPARPYGRGIYAGRGGGLYLRKANATLIGSTVASNTASMGGGVCAKYCDVTLNANTISGNSVNGGFIGEGGGLLLGDCDAVLRDNVIIGNAVRGGYGAEGGGLFLCGGDATLIGNIISGNAVYAIQNAEGAGLWIWIGGYDLGTATLTGNTIMSNTADYGGGLYLYSCGADVSLAGNIISGNTAHRGGGLNQFVGKPTIRGNTVSRNVAEYGGGLYLDGGKPTVCGNSVISNTAEYGGGLYLRVHGDAILSNNIVADNDATTAGSGLYIDGSSPHMLHTTIARNSGGNGSGLHVTKSWNGHPGSVALTNTILVSHTVGITVSEGCTATLEGTLWYGNGQDTGGAGTIVTGTVNVYGDPAFVDPDGGDYHIGPDSAAIDVGVDAGVETDIDNEPCPYQAPDLGADEYWPPGALKRLYLPLIMRRHS